jgi:hypothetical protein
VKRLSVLVGGALATLVLAAPAQATHSAPISFDYCDYSLRGGGTHPDNDLKRWWDAYEWQYKVDLVSSAIVDRGRVNDQHVRIRYALYNARGQLEATPLFRCLRYLEYDGHPYNDEPWFG